MVSRNGSPRPRRISHELLRAHNSRLPLSGLRGLLQHLVHHSRTRLCVALVTCGCILAPVAFVTGCFDETIAAAILAGIQPLSGDVIKTNHTATPSNFFQSNSTSQGNDASDATAAAASVPGTVFVRQSDCSVAGEVFTNVALTTTNGYNGTFSGTFTATATPNYGSTLHSLAGLTTTAGNFANGCTDRTAGIAGQSAALLAKTSGDIYVGAALDINNNLYIGAINPAGTYTATKLSLKNIFVMYVGDMNSEGVRQLLVPQLVPSTTGGYPTEVLYTINVHPDGTSDTPVQVTTPYSGAAFNLVVDDFNGDGKLDLGFTPANTSGAFTVLPGTGNGTFGAPIPSATVALNPLASGESLLTGDFNGDGKRDVLTGSNILFGNGDGTFTVGPASPSTGATIIADFNNDGKDDIATNAGGAVSIYLGKGDGTFAASGSAYANLYGAPTLAVSDIDGDGNLDLIVGQGQSGIYLPPTNGQGIIMFLMGNGDGTFQGAPVYTNAAGKGGNRGAFAAGDFNHDGNVDVLVPAGSSGGAYTGLQLLTGNGKGILKPQTVNTAVKPYFVTAADINGDGKLDAVTLALTSDSQGNSVPELVTLQGNGDGTFAAPVSYSVGGPNPNGYFSSNLTLGDTRGTGKPDAVFSQNGALYLLKNNGDGTFATPDQLDTEDGLQSLAATDINGDGKADIVALTTAPISGTLDTTGSLLVYLSHGDGTFAAPVTIASSLTDGQDMIVGDMNKDGKPDIVLLSSDSTTGVSSLTVYPGHGDGTFSAGVNSTLGGSQLVSLASADVNGDGNPDVLIGACCGYTLASIAFGKGDGTFAANYGVSIGPSTNAVGFADLNNDGRPDLLLATGENLVTSLNEFGSAPSLAPTTTALHLSPAAPTAGQSVTFSATVAPSSGNGTPTGTVAFLDGGTTIGTGTLSSGTASFTGSLAAGSHSITASYGGDTTYAGSVSAPTNLTVGTGPTLAATATQLTASATTASLGTTINFKASVSETSGTATPTGTVTFSDGTTAIGTASLASGVATFSTSALSIGTHSVTASYGGDTADAPSSSSAVVVTITAAAVDFSIALNPSMGSVNRGSSATSTVTITPAGGFSQPINLACSGLPANSTCTFSPASVTPNGTGPSSSTLTIATDVKAAFAPIKTAAIPQGTTSLAMLLGGGSLGLLLLGRRRKHPRLRLLQMCLVAAFVFTSVMIGCGGGSSSATATPTGTSQITVTATAGSTVHTATYSLTVQ